MEARHARDLEKDEASQFHWFGVLAQAADSPVDRRGLQMLDLTKTGLKNIGPGRLIAAMKDEPGAPAQRLRYLGSAMVNEEPQGVWGIGDPASEFHGR